MNQKVKKRWVAALRSGDYAQGRFSLERNGKRCCLGVLCAIDGQPTYTIHGGVISMPEESYYNSIGLTAHTTNDLAMMNDRNGKSFAEIADYIEANL